MRGAEAKGGLGVRMTRARYEELLGRALDSELSEAESAELRDAVESDAELLRDLREHLVLWDLWSQDQTTGRDGAAFLRSFQTRLGAEADTDSFAALTVQRITADERSRARTFWPLALAASLVVAVAWWATETRRQPPLAVQSEIAAPPLPTKPAAPSKEAQLIQVRGELVCAKCALHGAEVHIAAIRVDAATGDDLLFISSETAAGDLHGETFCAKPASVIAEGRIQETGNRRELLATRMEILRP